MEVESNLQKVLPAEEQEYDRAKELKAFDDTKAGVKGLVDAGVVKIPRMFLMQPEDVLPAKPDHDLDTVQVPIIDTVQVPIIDLTDIHLDSSVHTEVIEKIRYASEKWGFFQVTSHGIPLDILNEMIEGARRFHEQPNEVKMEFYSRGRGKKVKFYSSNFNLYEAKAASWRDTLCCAMDPNPPTFEEYPAACRKILMEYSKHVQSLGQTLFSLLSEALGLNPAYLTDIGCTEGHSLLCNYYPACPEPERTLGQTRHCDPDFLTILLQDRIGGLQVLHDDHWIDVPPLEGALVVNIGDLLQLISNDKFRSVEHRVLARNVGPRISVPCLFANLYQPCNKLYGPIKELLSADSPPLYKETLINDYLKAKIIDFNSALASLRL